MKKKTDFTKIKMSKEDFMKIKGKGKKHKRHSCCCC